MTRVSQLLPITRPDDVKVWTVSPETSIFEAVCLARKKNVGALPVLDGDVLVGIITERDFAFKILAERIDPDKETVANFMSPDPEYVSPYTDLVDCFRTMKKREIRHLPVLDNGKLVGIVSLRDVLIVLLENQEFLAQQFESYILGTR